MDKNKIYYLFIFNIKYSLIHKLIYRAKNIFSYSFTIQHS